MTFKPQDFEPEWGEPDPSFFTTDLPPPVDMPMDRIFSPAWVRWIENAAKAKSASPDYIVGALIATTSSLIANVRKGSPWKGWQEPTVMWAMNVGTPSMNKSPAMDAVLEPLRRMEATAAKISEEELRQWQEKADVAAIYEATWKEQVKAATKSGDDVPPRPHEADPGPRPRPARHVVSDATIEKLAHDLSRLPRGLLMFRDELSAWITGMTRYSGSSDQGFWIEAFGGRPYQVDRLGRESVSIPRLSIAVLGSIQPDRLRSLLLRSDNDGLTARFLTFWPAPAPIERPEDVADEGFLARSYDRLMSL